MRKLRLILAAALCLGAPLQGFSGLPAWETVQNYSAATVPETEKLEVEVREGYIYVSTPKAVTVKVLSIVGQLVSQQNIPAGVSRLKVPARGIYILKAGDLTMRVTI